MKGGEASVGGCHLSLSARKSAWLEKLIFYTLRVTHTAAQTRKKHAHTRPKRFLSLPSSQKIRKTTKSALRLAVRAPSQQKTIFVLYAPLSYALYPIYTNERDVSFKTKKTSNKQNYCATFNSALQLLFYLSMSWFSTVNLGDKLLQGVSSRPKLGVLRVVLLAVLDHQIQVDAHALLVLVVRLRVHLFQVLSNHAQVCPNRVAFSFRSRQSGQNSNKHGADGGVLLLETIEKTGTLLRGWRIE